MLKTGSFVVLMIVLSGSDPVFTDFIFDDHTIQTWAYRALDCLDYWFYGQAANRDSEHQSSTKGAAVTTSYSGVFFARETQIVGRHGKNARGIATSLGDKTSMHRACRS